MAEQYADANPELTVSAILSSAENSDRRQPK
jgi:hypothetical protein